VSDEIFDSILDKASNRLQKVVRHARQILEANIELKTVEPTSTRVTLLALMKALISLLELEAQLEEIPKPKPEEKPPEKIPVQLPPETVWREFTTRSGGKGYWCFPEDARDLYNLLKSGEKYSDEKYSYRLSGTEEREFVQRWPRKRRMET